MGELAKASMNKYYKIITTAISREIPPNNELDLVIKVRDEIVHFLPRVIERPGFKKNVPQWSDPLLKRGLLLSSPHPEIEVPLGDNLSSYRLAYWAWETIDAAIADYSNALGDESMRFICSENFKIYRSITSPSNLSTYDASNGLDLTR